MGDALYEELVNQAVTERNRALGEHANPDEYRDFLMAKRSVSFAKSETAAYASIASKTLVPTRAVTPREPTETKAPRQAPKEPKPEGREQSSNIFARDREK